MLQHMFLKPELGLLVVCEGSSYAGHPPEVDPAQ